MHKKLTSTDVKRLLKSPKDLLQNLPKNIYNRETITFDNCNDLAKNGIEWARLLAALPNLRKLSLKNLKSDGLRSFLYRIKFAKNLQSLEISKCSGITMADVIDIAKHSPLTELKLDLLPGVSDLREYKTITEDEIVALAMELANSLTSLSLENCYLENIKTLLLFPHLKKLKLHIIIDPKKNIDGQIKHICSTLSGFAPLQKPYALLQKIISHVHTLRSQVKEVIKMFRDLKVEFKRRNIKPYPEVIKLYSLTENISSKIEMYYPLLERLDHQAEDHYPVAQWIDSKLQKFYKPIFDIYKHLKEILYGSEPNYLMGKKQHYENNLRPRMVPPQLRELDSQLCELDLRIINPKSGLNPPADRHQPQFPIQNLAVLLRSLPNLKKNTLYMNNLPTQEQELLKKWMDYYNKYMSIVKDKKKTFSKKKQLPKEYPWGKRPLLLNWAEYLDYVLHDKAIKASSWIGLGLAFDIFCDKFQLCDPRIRGTKEKIVYKNFLQDRFPPMHTPQSPSAPSAKFDAKSGFVFVDPNENRPKKICYPSAPTFEKE